MMQAAKASGATLLPVDSEHNAIFQCLAGARMEDVQRITLTASGGPFRSHTREQMASVTPAQAVRHPNWRSEEHTSELQSLMRNSYAVFCLKKKTIIINKLAEKVTNKNIQYLHTIIPKKMKQSTRNITNDYMN